MIKKTFIVFLTVLTSSTLVYAKNIDPKKAVITSLNNKVELKYGVSMWREASIEQLLRPGTNIRTGSMSKVEIMYGDGSTARIGSRSNFTVLDTSNRAVKLDSGKMWFKVVKKSIGLQIKTPTAVAAITGTEGFAKFDDDTTQSNSFNKMFASNNGTYKISQGSLNSFSFGLVDGSANLFKIDNNGNPIGEAIRANPGDIITFSNGIFSINNVGIESILNQNREISNSEQNNNSNSNNQQNNDSSNSNSNNQQNNDSSNPINNNNSPSTENLNPSNVNTQQIPNTPNNQQNQNLNTSPTTGDLQIIIK